MKFFNTSSAADVAAAAALLLLPNAAEAQIIDGIDVSSIAGTCGYGWAKNGICEDKSLCCSQWGYCGTGDVYCKAENRAPIALCGNGDRGNGICPEYPEQGLCCSEFGHCGTSPDHCGGTEPSAPVPLPTSAPAPQPTAVVPNPAVAPVDGSDAHNARMIAYVGNWHACPTDAQIEQYTHIVIAFAVTYQWQSGGNQCDPQCTISKPLTCGNAENQSIIDRWRSMGKKVILSFGGAGMGGSWSGSNNKCWEDCFGKETYVVDQLTDLVQEMNLDGVDIDYEYFYENNQNGMGFSRGAEAQTFLKEVTLGLRSKLPPSSELTHAPMDPDVMPGTGYFNVLQEVAGSLDFLMPQYYNGYIQPSTNFPGALSHYTTLTNTLFGGDPTKVVFGFCISDCGTFNLSGEASRNVMENLAETYPCNGGAFFWVANDDNLGKWSSVVNQQLNIDAGREECTANDDQDEETSAPTAVPTAVPTGGTPVVTTPPPTEEICANDPSFLFKGKANNDCNWVLKRHKYKTKPNRKSVCQKRHNRKSVSKYCPLACNPACNCVDDTTYRHKGKSRRDCNYVKKAHDKGKGICQTKGAIRGLKVHDSCPVACGMCELSV